MPTADATLLLPPPFSREEAHADSSDAYQAIAADAAPRTLDHVGVEAVLGAMIEQKRRASQPDLPAYREGATTDSEAPSSEASERPGRPPTRSEVFLKVR